jgi:CRISPR-associated protein Cmr2
LLLIAIGPVQDFIATARKTRDLWFGSYLLSECSKSVARFLSEQRSTLIFPNLGEDPATIKENLRPGQVHGLNVCNIILGQIEAANLSEARAIAEKAEGVARDKLEDMAKSALAAAYKVAGVNQTLAEQQLHNLIEIYWSVTELKPDYKTARTRLYHALDARKATRDFQAATWGTAGLPKSSLDGAREIVTPNNDHHMSRLGLKKGERLCGVGLLKRLGIRGLSSNEKKLLRFSSTSSIAAAPLFTQENRSKMEDYFYGLANGDEDRISDLTGAALFEERLQEVLEAENPSDTQIQNAKNDLKKLLRDISGGKISKPLPYYALFLGDGDNMGKVIDHLTTIDAHQTFSSDLADFAAAARQTVEKGHSSENEHAQGCLIYAGGDDVLALLPLHTALKCAEALDAAFREAVGHYETKDDGTVIRPTLSAGMVIWHHLEPLDEALSAARTAEKTAKSFPGKNALCIAVSKRSGSATIVCDQFQTLTARLEGFVQAHVDNAFPDGAAYQLRDMLNDLEGLPEAQQSEAKRILARKKGSAEKLEAVMKRFDETLHAQPSSSKESTSESPTQRAERLHRAFEGIVNEIIVARIFADAKQQRAHVSAVNSMVQTGGAVSNPS